MNKNSIFVLSICSLFLFFKYIAQLFPSLIGAELMRNYGYDGIMLAVMASSYYYSYTFMHIIAGLIIDRFSIKMPLFFAITVISVMMLVFAHTSNFYLLCLSRVLMGVGASFATVLYMKCAAYYTTPNTFGIISSLLATATMLGAACGSAPIAVLFENIGWQLGLTLLAAIGFFIALSALLIKKSSLIEDNFSSNLGIISSLKEVISKKNNWLLLLYSGFTFSPVAILGGLWGVPFIMEKYQLTSANASFFLSTMFLGLGIGAPMWALISSKFGLKKELMFLTNLISLSTISIIIYSNVSYSALFWLFFTLGFSVGCFVLSFEFCRTFNSVSLMGLSVAFMNSGEGIVGSIAEPLIGYILDIYTTGDKFSLGDYQLALSILPICFIFSTITLSNLKISKTKPRLLTQNLAPFST